MTETLFTVTPKTAHERNRVQEHGEVWRLCVVEATNVDQTTRKFLESVKTGYRRWWFADRLS